MMIRQFWESPKSQVFSALVLNDNYVGVLKEITPILTDTSVIICVLSFRGSFRSKTAAPRGTTTNLG
jgi:hypothetical protein